jgi:16S rRNA (cytosine967-C5)-methyltransferase
LLHLGLYQVLFLDRIPPHAAVHETVEMARRQGLGAQAGFINAVLRGTLRDLPATRQALQELPLTNLPAASSHPAWLIDRWASRLATPDLLRLLQLNNTPPPTFARVNTLRTDAETLQRNWLAEGVVAQVRTFGWGRTETLFELKEHPPLAGLPSFQRGDFYLQDPSTLVAVDLLDPQPGETILDACAAPGGKTTLIAARMRNQGRVMAEDAKADRRRLLLENVVRLGASCVVAGPPPDPASGLVEAIRYDRVLIDAPCSNTGVLRRRVEARWRLQPESLARIRGEQRQILQNAGRRLRPGGVLVYSTCSLEPEENGLAVDEFLQVNPDFTREATAEALPWRDEVDGAFAARLRRTG